MRMRGYSIRFVRTVIASIAVVTILSCLCREDASSQAVQQMRPFSIGITLNDGSSVPLFLAVEALRKNGMPVRIVSIGQEGPLALRVREIDLLYTDGVSALMAVLKGSDLTFVGGALDNLTGSLFTAPDISGFSDPKTKTKRLVAAVLSYPSVRTSSEVTFDALAVRAVLRANGVSNVFVLPPNQPAPFVLPPSEPPSESSLLDGYVKQLNGGGIEFAYASVERVPWMVAKRAKELPFGPIEFQGVLIVARKSDVNSNIGPLVRFFRAFSEGIRLFGDPLRGPKALQEQLHLDAKTASYVHRVYVARGAFKVVPAPNSVSVSNLIQELARIVPDVSKLNVKTLIDARVTKPLEPR